MAKENNLEFLVKRYQGYQNVIQKEIEDGNLSSKELTDKLNEFKLLESQINDYKHILKFAEIHKNQKSLK